MLLRKEWENERIKPQEFEVIALNDLAQHIMYKSRNQITLDPERSLK